MSDEKMKKTIEPAAFTTNNALTLRRVGIDTYRENVAYMHRDCAVYRAEGFQALSKIKVFSGEKHLLARSEERRVGKECCR